MKKNYMDYEERFTENASLEQLEEEYNQMKERNEAKYQEWKVKQSRIVYLVKELVGDWSNYYKYVSKQWISKPPYLDSTYQNAREKAIKHEKEVRREKEQEEFSNRYCETVFLSALFLFNAGFVLEEDYYIENILKFAKKHGFDLGMENNVDRNRFWETEVEAILYLAKHGKDMEDFPISEANDLAENLAVEEKIKRSGGLVESPGHDWVEEECPGWDGKSRRCVCGARRCCWEYNGDFRNMYVWASTF